MTKKYKVPEHESPKKPSKSLDAQSIVRATMRWLALIVLGALALEGAKYLVKGDDTVREALAAVVVFLLFYVHLA